MTPWVTDLHEYSDSILHKHIRRKNPHWTKEEIQLVWENQLLGIPDRQTKVELFELNKYKRITTLDLIRLRRYLF